MGHAWYARWRAALSIVVGVIVGCGADSAAGPKSYVGEKASALISTKDGGKLQVGAVLLDVPPGAVSKDTTLTAEVVDKSAYPGQGDVAIDVYELGPSGTVFDKPVKLSFEISDVDAKDREAVVAVREDGNWNVLNDSERKGDKVEASTKHFSSFTVLLISPGQGAPACGETFEACGGDLVGTWRLEQACVQLEVDPDFAACSDPPTESYDIGIAGEMTFGADGSFSLERTFTIGLDASYPNSCLAEVELTCEELAGTTQASACVVMDSFDDVQTDSGTYTADSGKLDVVSNEPDPEDTSVLTYCVNGDFVTVRVEDSTGTLLEYTATRQ